MHKKDFLDLILKLQTELSCDEQLILIKAVAANIGMTVVNADEQYQDE